MSLRVERARCEALRPKERIGLSAMFAWIARLWNIISYWVQFLICGPSMNITELVDFVIGNHFFWAMQIPSELQALGRLVAALCPGCALEIGTAKGGTLLFLTRLASPSATIVSVDLPGGRFGGDYGALRRQFYPRFARGEQKLCLLQGDSHSTEMLSRVKAAFDGRSVDYLFIDGDHSYDGVKSDFEMYGGMVGKGGFIAFHDIVEGNPALTGGVAQFWREIKPMYRHSEIIESPQQGGYGIGILYVD